MADDLDPIAGADGKDPDESRRLAKFWHEQLDLIRDSGEYKRWITRGEQIEKRYRDERNRMDEEGQRHYNSLWANTEILLPALYGRCPVPVAERRFRDKDPVGRGAAQILERALRNEIEICGFDEALQHAVKDYLLPGRGTIWVRYEPQIEESVSLPPESQTDMKDAEGEIAPTVETEGADSEKEPESGTYDNENPPDEGDEKLHSTGDRVLRESTPVDYVYWQDFYILPMRARTWAEVTAVGKRVYMSRNQMKKRFGKKIGGAIPLRKDERGQRSSNPSQIPSEHDKGAVIEIWSKEDSCVYWIAEGYEYLCDRKDDPLKLENFFPCPRPLFSNPTNNTLLPVPDYIQYQDQAIQIDELTQRISMLAKACKVAGVYNAAANDIKRLLDESVENELIPVDDWAAFAEKGGVEGNISLLPLKEVMGVLNELMTVKQQQVEEMDRLTGINDIMRGTSDARETLGGVRLKANNTGTRLQRRQNEVARFAREALRIMADIMAQHFSPQSLIEVSGALYEEGLGSPDMPSLSTLNGGPAGLQGPAGNQPSVGPPGGLGSAPQNMAPGPGAVPPGGPSPQGNVLPFKPPGQGLSPGGAQAPQGQLPPPSMPPAGPPPLPPELMAKLEGIRRIAEAIKLIRDERLRGFRVDIEVDSTIYGDYAEEREERTQFLTAVTGFLQQGMQMSAVLPEITPLMGKLLQFGVRGFKVGRDLEAAIEDFCEEAPRLVQQKIAQQQAAGGDDPARIKAQADMIKAKSQAKATEAKSQQDVVKSQTDIKAMQLKGQMEERNAQAEVERQAIENEGERMNSQADIQAKQVDLEIKRLELQLEVLRMQAEMKKMEAQQQLAQQQAHHESAKMQMDAHMQQENMHMQQEQNQMQREQSHFQHQQAMTPQPMTPHGPTQTGTPKAASSPTQRPSPHQPVPQRPRR